MALLITPETPYGKEMWKWDHTEGETHPSDGAVRGMRPSGYRAYPAMVYKVSARNPLTFESAVVTTDAEERNYLSRGFVAGGQAAAVEAYDAQERELATIAAARNYEDRLMSDKAKAERDAAEEESSRHLGAIPETPIRRRVGRPAKTTE